MKSFTYLNSIIDTSSKDNKLIEYQMLHKNKIVLKFNIYKNRLAFGDGIILDYAELPPLLQIKKSDKILPDEYINEWLNQRGIKLNKLHYNRLIKQLKIDDEWLIGEDTKSLVIRTNALSLNDCYWIKPVDSDIRWEDINFFSNDFDVAINNLYCDTIHTNQVFNFKGTPNNTTQGQLRKVWEIDDNKRILFKKSDGLTKTDVVNELVVSRYLDVCSIDHIKYTLGEKYGGLGCFCENACSEDLEFISFNDYISNNFDTDKSEVENINNLIDVFSHDNPSLRSDFENMVLVDILFSNVDRHWGNFGFLRDSNTLKIVKSMPIFDNGFCLMGSEPDYSFFKHLDDPEARRSKIDGRFLFDTFDYLRGNFNTSIIKYVHQIRNIIITAYVDNLISVQRLESVLDFVDTNIEKCSSYIK